MKWDTTEQCWERLESSCWCRRPYLGRTLSFDISAGSEGDASLRKIMEGLNTATTWATRVNLDSYPICQIMYCNSETGFIDLAHSKPPPTNIEQIQFITISAGFSFLYFSFRGFLGDHWKTGYPLQIPLTAWLQVLRLWHPFPFAHGETSGVGCLDLAQTWGVWHSC